MGPKARVNCSSGFDGKGIYAYYFNIIFIINTLIRGFGHLSCLSYDLHLKTAPGYFDPDDQNRLGWLAT